jgi:hypothetical protein
MKTTAFILCGRKRRAVVMALILAGLAGGVAIGSARAEDDGNRGHDRGRGERDFRGHERDREWREQGRREGAWREEERRAHGYVYAPPPVYYAPPPSPAALNFVFPLTIR